MSRVKKENVDLVVNALVDFYNQIVNVKKFSLRDFYNFMEPKFIEAGYRSPQSLTNSDGSVNKTNILIISDDAVGDFILTTGTIREIRRLYPDAYITLVVGKSSLVLAEPCPYVDEVLVNEKNFRLQSFLNVYKGSLQMATQLLKRRFDICFTFIHNITAPLLMYMSGARIRVARACENDEDDDYRVYGVFPVKYLTSLATHRVKSNFFGKHMADLSFNLLDIITQIPISNREIELWYTALDITATKSIIGDSHPVYALCMGGSGPHRHYKHYPPESYAKVLEMIVDKEPTAKFLILGGGKIDEECRDILKNSLTINFFEEHAVDLIGKLSYRQSAAILSLCDMYIGNNTGTLHAAAAVKCPVLEVNCFPADLPANDNDLTVRWCAYQVPTVVVQPAHALDECKVNDPYIFYGCRVPKPHCITQITPKTIFKGFNLLKQRIAQNNIEPLYIH